MLTGIVIARLLARLTVVFKRVFCVFVAFPRKIKAIGNNWNTIGLLQYYYWVPFGYLGNTSVVQNRGNTIAIVFCAALLSLSCYQS